MRLQNHRRLRVENQGEVESILFVWSMLTVFCMTSTTIPYPNPWCQYKHPNGDIYYYNPQLRLITPEYIRNSDILEYIMDAREDHLQCLDGDPNRHLFPPDYDLLVVSDDSETAAVLRMYFRMAGEAYNWTEERGLVIFTIEFLTFTVSSYCSCSHYRISLSSLLSWDGILLPTGSRQTSSMRFGSSGSFLSSGGILLLPTGSRQTSSMTFGSSL